MYEKKYKCIYSMYMYIYIYMYIDTVVKGHKKEA